MLRDSRWKLEGLVVAVSSREALSTIREWKGYGEMLKELFRLCNIFFHQSYSDIIFSQKHVSMFPEHYASDIYSPKLVSLA